MAGDAKPARIGGGRQDRCPTFDRPRGTTTPCMTPLASRRIASCDKRGKPPGTPPRSEQPARSLTSDASQEVGSSLRDPTIHGTPWMLGLGRAALDLDPTYVDRQRLSAIRATHAHQAISRSWSP